MSKKREQPPSPSEMIRQTLEREMTAATCDRYFLPERSSWLKGLTMAQFQRALEGDSAAYRTLLEIAYPNDFTPAYDDEFEDALSASLRQLVESL